MGTTRSFDLAGIRCTFAQDTARDCAASPRAPLVDSAHHLSDALQAEQAEITHFQETTQRLKCQMHELLSSTLRVFGGVLFPRWNAQAGKHAASSRR